MQGPDKNGRKIIWPFKSLDESSLNFILKKVGSVALSVLFRKWKELLVANASREVIFSDTQKMIEKNGK